MNRLEKWQDKLLQRLVRTGKTVRSIAKEVNVSDNTVTNCRRACAAVDVMPAKLKEEVRRLLFARMSLPKIAARLRVSPESIRDLRRLDRFRDIPECSKCGTKFFTPQESSARPAREPEHRSCQFTHKNVANLLRVVRDLIELNDLRLVTHPLFYHLSQRAEKVYEEVYAEETKQNE
jgi:IS30 family transposase